MKHRVASVLFGLVLFLSAAVSAQTTNATLSGTVLDPARAVVPNTRVAAENVGTGVVLTAMTNDAGIYLFPSVQPGVYRLTAEAQGFRRHVFNEVTVEVGARININFSLQVAAAGETVDVTAQPDLLLTGTATVGGVISGRQVQELPLPDRNALGLVLTQPGLVGDNFAGARIGALNVTIDGVNVMDQSVNSGVKSVVFSNVDNVDEVRVVTSPVDAEFGRGSGQVQISTRSGSKDFHGSVYEFHRNTAFNANNWFNNLRGQPRDTLISHNFGGRLGGPITRERTFFHFNYDGLRNRTAESVTAATYTQSARQGIFRFYPGVQNGNANAAVPTVDVLGNPVRPVTAAGALQSVNLFGRDPNRPAFDPSGTIQKFLTVMPLPNDFRSGDGLNTAGYTWRRRTTSDFNQYNLKIDHTISNRHRASFAFTREDLEAPNGFMAQNFPRSPGGSVEQVDALYVINVNSTFSGAAFNEFHAGAQRARARYHAPWELPGGRELMPAVNGYGYLPVFALVADPIRTDNDPQGRISPLYVYGDTFHLNKGKHDVKFGGELRFASTNGFDSFGVMPRVAFGYGFGPDFVGINSFAIPGLGTNEASAQLLLADLAGSVDNVTQSFNATFGSEPIFTGDARQRTWRQRELSLFVQDDFKLKSNVTFNLGMRYEFYGVPWDANGRTAGVAGGSTGLFGISGTSWADMYRPGRFRGSLTQVQLIGKRSPIPNTQLYNNDWNNFAPVVGLSWSVPYFGKDKTILRAGYSVAYPREALRLVDIVASDQPGLRTESFDTSDSYLNLTGIRLPLEPIGSPLETVPLTDRSQSVWAFDNNLRTPYIQNWNLTVQRELPGNFTLDVRYVGSKGTKLIRTVNVNEVNIFETGIADAFRVTQAGGNAPLLDRLFEGFNLGLGTVNGRTVTGSASVRAFTSTRGFLAHNNVGAFASYLNTLPVFGERGALLRFADLPENWIVVNPQFGGALYVGNFSNSTYHSLQLDLKKRLSKGWTLESNYTWSRALGDEEGDSQNLLNSYRNGRDRQIDKRLLLFHRTHVLRNSGIWELPLGPNRFFLSRSSGVLARLVEGWQIGGIFNAFSGEPSSLYAAVSSFNQHLDNTATLVGSLPKHTGAVKRTDNGVVYFDGLKQVDDPTIGNLTSLQLLNTRSTLKAIADSADKIVAVNPTPGTLGSLSQTYLEGPGAFRLDVNLLKKIPLREGKELILRADAINLLNSPIFGNPVTDINSTNFGRITNAGGNREVVLSGRINF